MSEILNIAALAIAVLAIARVELQRREPAPPKRIITLDGPHRRCRSQMRRASKERPLWRS